MMTKMPISSTDRDWIEQQARSEGFDLSGIASVPDETSEEHATTSERFSEWIAAGHAGEMDYLKRVDDAGQLVRGNPRRAIPWARSVIVCAVNYATDAPRSIEPAPMNAGWIGRYAWSGGEPNHLGYTGSDYHQVLLKQLRKLDEQLKQRFACSTQCYVDTGPILERDYAARAGIGWIGKNTCILNQQQGSWLLLGVIVTSLELTPETASLASNDRCGSCTRCIDACPTQALISSAENGARQMDASRCIAYLTIEKKGSIPEELRAPMGRQVFGCDICQDVCPWNRKSVVSSSNPLSPRPELVNPSLHWLASLEGSAFTQAFRGSPVEPTRRQTSRRKLLRRNIAIAMGNSRSAEFLPKLDEWALSEDPTLAESATWAAASIRTNAK
jgi:epoxyqueuosine reductase